MGSIFSLKKQSSAASPVLLCSSDSTLEDEYEGEHGRVVRLFHATSPGDAEKIIAGGKILRGSEGSFGDGLYFAETEIIAKQKAPHNGAIVDAFVALGRSLICRDPRLGMDYDALTCGHRCESVKGLEGISPPEYVVYNWAQVCIREIRIGDASKWISGEIYIGLGPDDFLNSKKMIEERGKKFSYEQPYVERLDEGKVIS